MAHSGSNEEHSAAQNKGELPADKAARKVINGCYEECFWFRSLPAFLLNYSLAHLAVRRGLYKPPKGLLGSTIVHFVGIFIVTDAVMQMSFRPECERRVLRQAPDSEVALKIRLARGHTFEAAQVIEEPQARVAAKEEEARNSVSERPKTQRRLNKYGDEISED